MKVLVDNNTIWYIIAMTKAHVRGGRRSGGGGAVAAGLCGLCDARAQSKPTSVRFLLLSGSLHCGTKVRANAAKNCNHYCLNEEDEAWSHRILYNL